MQPIDRLLEKINFLKYGNKEFLSNAFFNAKQLEQMLVSPNVILKVSDNVVIILEEEEWLIRLYFYSHSEMALSEISSIIPDNINKPIIADIVGKGNAQRKLVESLITQGFYEHNVLIRMQRNPKESLIAEDIEFATIGDLESILKMLYSVFDVRTSRLPTADRVAKAIENNEIIVLRKEQGALAGFAYFETLGGRTKYLYQIVVDISIRGRGIGDKLLKQGYSRFGEGTIFVLWVESKNDDAIRMYEKHGFNPDGLVDYILQYKRGGVSNEENY